METNSTAMPGYGHTTGTADKKRAADDDPRLIDEIRDKGFRVYVEEIHARKMEELRARILESMGLTEEELRALPAEQRQTIEDMIAEKIRRHMMTESATNGGNGPFTGIVGDGVAPAGDESTGGDTATGNGFDTGLALLRAIELTNAPPDATDDGKG